MLSSIDEDNMLTSIAEDRETADTVPQDKLMAYARAAVAAAAEKKRIQAEINWAELENAPEEGRRGATHWESAGSSETGMEFGAVHLDTYVRLDDDDQ